MNEKIDVCVLRCFTTEKGSMCMSREFGLDVTDQRGPIRRSQVQAQLSKYYPDVKGLTVKQTGENTYKIDVKGYYEAE